MGAVCLLDTVTLTDNPAVDTTKNITQGLGGHSHATFYAVVTTIGSGDTWQITVRWKSLSGAVVNVAQSATFTTTGLKELVNQAPFTSTNRAVPSPTEVFYDNSVDGGVADTGLAATVWAIYGD